jgi:hypothetical protein
VPRSAFGGETRRFTTETGESAVNRREGAVYYEA